MSGELKRLLIEIRGGGGGKTTTIIVCSNNVTNDHGGGDAAAFILPRLAEWRQGQQAKVLKQFCRSISLTPIKFHTLRACFATQIISEGVEPIKVMKVCGWMDLKTMARYVRLSGVDESGVTDKLCLLS